MDSCLQRNNLSLRFVTTTYLISKTNTNVLLVKEFLKKISTTILTIQVSDVIWDLGCVRNMDKTPLAAEPHFKKIIDLKGKRHIAARIKNGDKRFIFMFFVMHILTFSLDL